MALKYTNYIATPYGTNPPLTGANISLCTPSQQPPRVVMADINWSNYTSGRVTIDLNLMVAGGFQIDKIQSIYIDNIGMVLPVTVLFADTLFEASCLQNATSCQEVATGQLRFDVILGTTALNLTNLKNATTRIYVSNVNLGNFLNPNSPQSIPFYETSNAIGTPQNFMPKAAGELRASWQFNFPNSGTPTVNDLVNGGALLGANLLANFSGVVPNAGVYLIVTDIHAFTQNMYIASLPGVEWSELLWIGKSAFGQGTMNFLFNASAGLASYDFVQLQDSHNLNFVISPFSSILTYGVNSAPSLKLNGTLTVDIQFTYISSI